MEKNDDKDFGPDRQNAQLQTFFDQASKASRSRRKQENPQRKKVEMHATRGDKKKIAKKPQQKKRGGEKKLIKLSSLVKPKSLMQLYKERLS